MKRICIYVTYDKQKIVDRYIGYMLQELKTCADYLAVVCNEPEVVRGLKILETYADAVFFRENIGFDAGGFKDALVGFLGWEKVLEYEELVLVNDSLFGPFQPMSEIFSEMDKRKADFWGLAMHGEGRNDYVGPISEHIQSYFLTIRYHMLHDPKFRQYWEEMPYYTDFLEVIRQYEIGFTRFFASLGYQYASLADTKINDSDCSKNNYSQYMFLAYELIKKRNFPFLKKQPIRCETLYCQTQENLRLAMEYIRRETPYDINYIWDNILRTMNISDLQRSLSLQYIVTPDKDMEVRGRVMILIFITHPKSSETVLEYLEELDKRYDIRIFSQQEDYLREYEKQGLICEKRDAQGLKETLMSYCEYDYVCVLHDEDMTSEIRPSCTGKSCFYNVWENLAKDGRHISGICKLFEGNPRLGFLMPPHLNFGEYFSGCTNGWEGNFEMVQHTLQQGDIHCQLSELKPPFRVSESFWIRGRILRKLDALKLNNPTLLSYLWIYLAQDAGFYSGIVESPEYASMNEVNEQYYLRNMLSQFKREYGEFHTFSEWREKLLTKALAEFCGRYSRIFVYGIGEMLGNYKELFSDIEAYLVSPGHTKPEMIDGIPVRYVSELLVSPDCGVILCLNERNQRQVIPLLESYGLKNYFCI